MVSADGAVGGLLFWVRMSLAIMVGAAFAFPLNWWLVAHHLKYGMLTVRPKGKASEMPGVKQKMDIAASTRSAIY